MDTTNLEIAKSYADFDLAGSDSLAVLNELTSVAGEKRHDPEAQSQEGNGDTATPLAEAVEVSQLQRSRAWQQFEADGERRAEEYDALANDLKRVNGQRYFDRAAGIRELLALARTRFDDAEQRLLKTSNEERLRLPKQVRPSVRPAPVEQAAIAESLEPTYSEADVRANTARMVRRFESEKKYGGSKGNSRDVFDEDGPATT